MSRALVEARGLVKRFAPPGAGLFARGRGVVAVDHVDLVIERGEVVGLVGESGSGKTTLGRLILRLVEADEGTLRFGGVDVRALGGGALRRLRRRMQVVFQDPAAALNPRLSVGALVGEPLSIHGVARGRELAARIRELLAEVGLDPALAARRPGELSGGQRQRVGIARAIGLRPELVVLDEPTAALDVSVQAQVVNLLARLREAHGMAYLFIAHDLPLVAHFADRVLVMYRGRIVEEGPRETLVARPRHPYTRALLDASPALAGAAASLGGLDPELAQVGEGGAPAGCAYAARCPFVVDRCREEVPALSGPTARARAACHRADEIDLSAPRVIPEAPGSL